MKAKYLYSCLLASSFIISSCTGTSNFSEDIAKNKPTPNILFMIGDDMGKDTLSCYSVGNSQAKTPNLDNLCAAGVRFDTMWTHPYCSPTRAALLTGKYSAESGVFYPILPKPLYTLERLPKPEGAPPENRIMLGEKILESVPPQMQSASRGLRRNEMTIARKIKESGAGYATGAFGKWHLSDTQNGGLEHPNLAGFDHYSGFIEGTMGSFFSWRHVENGSESVETGYFTSRIVDDTIEWIEQQQTPWFAWVAFTAPHEPFHKPPSNLLSAATDALDAQKVGEVDDHPYFLAAIEAMDTEIGRLLAGIPEDEIENTIVIFIGDNGSPTEVAQAPYSPKTVKGSFFEGGIDMPFIIAGPDIESGVYPHLAAATDFFDSVLSLANIEYSDAETPASISFVEAITEKGAASPRDWIYSDGSIFPFGPVNRAIRNERYKLIRSKGLEYLFDLKTDPYEASNLMQSNLSDDAQAAYDFLSAQLDQIPVSDIEMPKGIKLPKPPGMK